MLLAHDIFKATLFMLVGIIDREAGSRDIRELDIPAPELSKNDAEVRALFGERSDSRVHLSIGSSPVEARRALEECSSDGRGIGRSLQFHEHAHLSPRDGHPLWMLRGQIGEGYAPGKPFLDYYRPALLTSPPMRPSSVRIPVSTTTAVLRP